MARFLNELTIAQRGSLRAVMNRVIELKPPRWSVVWRENELSIRPIRRESGKFSVQCLGETGIHAAFFDRKRNRWTRRKDFAAGFKAVDELIRWMTGVVKDACSTQNEGP
jgi:hypothetical protein